MVTDEMNQNLIKSISKEEITAVVFQLRAYKMLGPDGISGIFYLVKDDVVKAILSFLKQER